MVETLRTRKAGATRRGVMGDFLAIHKIDCLGSAVEAVATGSMATTIFPSPIKGADP